MDRADLRLVVSAPALPAVPFEPPRPPRRRARPRLRAPLAEPRDIDLPLPESFRSEFGDALPDRIVRVRRYGRRAGPVIVVMGGISSGRLLSGETGWWKDIVGPDLAIDLHRFSVLGLDFAPLSDCRVRLSPKTQAQLLLHALDALGVGQVAALIGASYGGMVALAFAALAPGRLSSLCVISACDRPHPMAAAWRGIQRRMLEFALLQGRPEEGLSLARQLAMTTYRSSAEFGERFHGVLGGDGRSDVDHYLLARGRAYVETMAPLRWLSLSESIDRCRVPAECVLAPTTLIACASDQIAPLKDIRALARKLPACRGLYEIHSRFGHDAFLKETALMAERLRIFLSEVEA